MENKVANNKLERISKIVVGTQRIFLGSLMLSLSKINGDQEGIRIGIAERRMGLGELTDNRSRYNRGNFEVLHIYSQRKKIKEAYQK
jgi:hypothetical protein